jgi:hypothetical protein
MSILVPKTGEKLGAYNMAATPSPTNPKAASGCCNAFAAPVNVEGGLLGEAALADCIMVAVAGRTAVDEVPDGSVRVMPAAPQKFWAKSRVAITRRPISCVLGDNSGGGMICLLPC